MSLSLRIFSSLALPSSVLSFATVSLKKSELVAKRLSSGIPSSYLPVRRPDSSGDQIVVPYFSRLKSSAYSDSGRRWRML